MKKYKLKTVKFVFTPKQIAGRDWKEPCPSSYRFGNKFTETTNKYEYHQHHIGILFSDELQHDKRKYDKKAKFSESEASILLLEYLKNNLKESQKEKRRLDRLDKSQNKYPKTGIIDQINEGMMSYARIVNNRELKHNKESCKIWRKIVKEIKESPEYIWELLNK